MTEARPAGSSAYTFLLRRHPPRGTGADATVVFTLEDIAVPPGEDPRATAVVVIGPEVTELRSFEVVADHRGNGLGRRLLREVVDSLRAQGCRRLVTTLGNNERGARVLCAAGFGPAGTDGTRALEL